MKTKIIFLFLFFVNQLFAINSNGFVANINGFDFQENINHEINSNYLQAISNISCGDGGSDEVTTILQSVDLKAGKFTCLKYLPGQSEPEKIEFSLDSTRLASEKSALKNFIDNNLGTAGVSFYNQLGSYVFPGTEIDGRTNYISSVNISELYNNNASLLEYSKNNNSVDINIDSHTNSKETLSNILTGIFLLNPDYFANDVLTENGALKINERVVDNGSQQALNQQAGIIDKAIRLFAKEKNEDKELQTFSLTDFMDKKFWGFYVYFLINIEQAFSYILGTMLLFGAGYIGIKAGFRKFKKKVLKIEDQNNNSSFGAIAINGFVAITIFLIPVSTAPITVPDKFLYEKSINQDIPTSSESEFYQNSTLAKVTLRFFADQGSTWANTVSDYSLYSYLRFLEAKQGFVTERQVTQNTESIKKLFEDIFYLKKDFDFLNNVCKPAFSDYLVVNQRFNTISKDAHEQLLNAINLSSNSINKALKVDRIEPAVCQKLEKDVFTNSRKILSDYAFLRQQIKINQEVIKMNNGSNADAQKVGFQTFVDLIQFQQNNYGWINSVSVPVTYNLLFLNTNPVFNEDVVLEKIKDSNDYNLISAWSKNDEQKSEIKNSIDDSSLASFFGHIQSKFAWFVFPGFDSVYNNMYQLFSNIAGLDPTAQQMGKSDDSNMSKAISTVKNFFAGKLSGPLSLLGPGTMKVLSAFGNFVLGTITSALQYGILMYLSLIVAIFIYTTMITSAILIFVAGAAIIKMIMYFLEAIINSIVVDLLLFYALVTNKKEYFDAFIGKSLVVLILTPLAIVFANYIYIFISTAAIDLYLLLIGMTFDTIAIANDTIIANSENSFLNGLTAMVSAISLKALGVVVVHFLSALFGIYLIFKLKDMLLNMIGINSDDSNISKMTDSLQQRMTGDMVRV
ncbi:hypothetical protein QUR76_08415 [Arcobacter cryaerophilus gv. pseudocryaerophilus]|uniref:Uncharacterized protein n=3 Tax=unclassified Arcobacter TaxID=2593671 RepID=A0AA96L640_9BACT|nr:hypothetical protein RMQ65_10505 [Arcobacter sp. AZ-2023]WPD05146.1 hypothetical protein QUR76_08415 [Arcobacter sp. DSM 115956]WPD07240.1 hypothetical protein QUR78_08410 [Arcobacter sp. DSM 115955]WNL31505.1 hypothetical protein RMQ67_08410 [Arcobacter sp. AZ-2023]WNP37655.1 hypothetical protein RJG58_08410 [Arcobacter sp. AZ-2023]